MLRFSARRKYFSARRHKRPLPALYFRTHRGRFPMAVRVFIITCGSPGGSPVSQLGPPGSRVSRSTKQPPLACSAFRDHWRTVLLDCHVQRQLRFGAAAPLERGLRQRGQLVELVAEDLVSGSHCLRWPGRPRTNVDVVAVVLSTRRRHRAQHIADAFVVAIEDLSRQCDIVQLLNVGVVEARGRGRGRSCVPPCARARGPRSPQSRTPTADAPRHSFRESGTTGTTGSFSR
jgi:hypothetical protein